MFKLAVILGVLITSTTVYAQFEEEGSGEDVTTRPRPEMESSECQCILAAGKKAFKLAHLMGDPGKEIEVEYTDTEQGCLEAQKKCVKHCAGLGSSLFTDGFSAQLSGKSRGFNLGSLLCHSAGAEEPMSMKVTSRFDARCQVKQAARGYGRGEKANEYSTAFSYDSPLCCKEGANRRFSPASCAATVELGSGDDTRPRPDEQPSGSVDEEPATEVVAEEPVTDAGEVQAEEYSGDEPTRPRPEEATTKVPRMKEMRCHCYAKSTTASGKDKRGGPSWKSGAQSYRLRHLMGDDVADEVTMKFVDSAEGCQEGMSKCSKHCAGVSSKLFAGGYTSQLSAKGKWYTLGDFFCSGARSGDPLTIEITGKVNRRCRNNRAAKKSWHSKFSESEMVGFTYSEPLCCKRGWKRFTAGACDSA